jgi:hypothetical protein
MPEVEGRSSEFCGLCQRIRPPGEDAFVEHAPNVPVTRHAAPAGPANLRHALHGLRFVCGNGFADFAFRHVQTMAQGPGSCGGCRSVSRSVALTEIHDCYPGERIQGRG